MLARLRRWTGLSSPPPAEPDASPRPQRQTPVDVTDEDFAHIVLDAGRLAIVGFWADWRQPCTIMSAYMEFLMEEFGDEVLIVALDVEENEATAAKYGIMGLPTLVMFRNGDEIDRQVGLVDYDALRQKVQQLLSVPPLTQ